MITNKFEAMNETLLKFNEQYQEDIKYIQETIKEDSEFGRFALHLFTTERDTSFIINSNYHTNDANEFSSLLHDIHHALFDDGELTFYLVDDTPRFSLNNNFNIKDCLLPIEKTLQKDLNDIEESNNIYVCKILKVSVDEWIKLSEEYHIKNLKEMFLFDMIIEPELLNYYRKYKHFDENWIKEIKC